MMKNFLRNTSVRLARLLQGQSTTEYAMVMIAIAVACLAAYQTFGVNLVKLVSNIDATF